MFYCSTLLIASLLPFALSTAENCSNTSSLPIVNLGYEQHQAISLNETAGFYNFTNIRYAEPPVGDLRFKAPLPPKGHSSLITNGSIGRVCPQASPSYFAILPQFTGAYLEGQPFNLSAAEASQANSSSGQSVDPRTTEDCLFLDVYAPKKFFEETSKPREGAPVLVWISGGGYVSGDKMGFSPVLYNPSGLIGSSQTNGSDGIVFVALNYRLGAFGFLAGPTLQPSDGISNAGLYDQRLALQWIRDNIHLFGGDKERVTVMGESAGGGSVMHQITAFGGLKGPAPFSQAIIQSPSLRPLPGSLQQEQTYTAFLSLLNVSTVEEARRLPLAALIKANAVQVGQSYWGDFTYGPAVDGLFVPALPGRLLSQGSFDQNIRVLVGHNSDEGLLFTNPTITNSSAFAELIQTDFPDISPTVANFVENVLYPPVFNGSYGYTSQFERAILFTAEHIYTCNANFLARAFSNQSYGYEFSVPPALHGQDVPYTFYTGPSPAVANATVAAALQDYITSFAMHGAPSGAGMPAFPLYEPDSKILNLNISSIEVIKDPTANERCVWWQKALYY